MYEHCKYKHYQELPLKNSTKAADASGEAFCSDNTMTQIESQRPVRRHEETTYQLEEKNS